MIVFQKHYLKYFEQKTRTVYQKKKELNTPIYFNSNYRTERKLTTNHHGLLFTSDRCFKIFLRDLFTWGGLYLTLIFSM